MARIYLVILPYDAPTLANLVIVVEDDVLQLEGIVDDGAGDVEPRAHVHVSHEAPQKGRVGF